MTRSRQYPAETYRYRLYDETGERFIFHVHNISHILMLHSMYVIYHSVVIFTNCTLELPQLFLVQDKVQKNNSGKIFV